MSFKWPKKLKNIGVNDYRVRYLSRVDMDKIQRPWSSGGAADGIFNPGTGTIYICTQMSESLNKKTRNPREIMQLLAHEFIHAVNNSYSLDLGESKTDVLAVEIVKLMESCGMNFIPSEVK